MSGLQVAFLYMAPWLALFAVLACGRYPGEGAIARVRARRKPGARIRVALVATPGQHFRGPACGGLVLAWRLAGRGPPC